MTERKEKALLALIANPDRKQAAKAAKITDRTLRSYFQDPEFQQAYTMAYREMVADATARATSLMNLSLETLEHIMRHGDSDATRTTAARITLEYSVRLRELSDVTERLTALEAWREETESEN